VVQLLNDDDWVASVDPDHPGFNVLSIAKVGFEMKQMPTDHDLIALDYVRSEFARQDKPFAFDAFMVSGGGNDFMPKIQTYVSGGNGQAQIDDAALDAIFDLVATRWTQLLARLVPGEAPVLTNGYGPIVPTLVPGSTWLPLLGIGPWVGPWLLQHCGLDLAAARAVVATVNDRFNARVAAIAGVAYFDLRPTVAAMPASYWHDEIHFTAPGWKRVAHRWMEELDARAGRTPLVGATLRSLRMPALAGTAPMAAAAPARKRKPAAKPRATKPAKMRRKRPG
jgi:hypothetical protein